METTRAKKKMGLTESLAWLGFAAIAWFCFVWVVGCAVGILYGVLKSGFNFGMMAPWL